jgi:nicotinamidase-related amidase
VIPADPYPWPCGGSLDSRRLALVIAGDQPAWALRSAGVAETAAVIAEVAGAVRDGGGVVVHVRHGRSVAPRAGFPPARGAPGWALTAPAPAGDLVVDAGGIDGFYGSSLDQELRDRGVDTLVLAGYGGEATVSSTLRSANDRGYECLTLVDGVAMFDRATGASTLHSITMSGGIFGAIAPSAALLAVLVPTALEAIPC